MTALSRIARISRLTVALLTVTTSVASAQFGGGSLHGTSVALSANAPFGDFDTKVQTGFGLALYTGLGEPGEAWSGRGTFGFDRFGGKGTLDNVQFISYGFNIVHHSGTSFYQFGGLGLHTTTYNYKSQTDQVAAGTRNGSNFGLTGGIGVNFGSPDGTQTFVEFAATTLFTGNKNSAWFPVRIGLRF